MQMIKSESNAVLKNVFFLSLGKIVSLILNVVALVFVARQLGSEKFGIFSSLLSTIIIFSKVVDLGIVPVVFKEYSKSVPNKKLFSTAFSIRIVVFFVVGITFNLWFYLTDRDTIQILLANLLFINVVISAKYVNFRELLEIPFKSALKTAIPMIAAVLDSLLLLFAVIYMVAFDKNLTFFVVAYAITNIPGFLLMIYYLVKEYRINFRITFHSGKWLILSSLPIWGYTLLNSVFQQLDIILLERMTSSSAAGIYSVAPRFLTPVLIIPSIIVGGFYPVLVRNFDENKRIYELLKNNVFKILLFVSFTAAGLITFKIDYIIDIVFGVEFSDADIPTILLFWAQVFLFYSFFVKNILVIYNTQKWNFYESAFVLLINLGLNILLIPLYAQNGAAMAKITAALAGFVISVFALYKSGDKLYIFTYNILLWAVLIILFLFLISGLNPILYLLLSILFILIVTLAVKYFTREEIYYIFKAINKVYLWEKLNKNILFTIFYKKS